MSADHEQLRELLGAFVLGGLEADDRARLGAHLGTCEQCRTELSTYAGLPALLRRGAAADQATDPGDGRLTAALDAARAARGRTRRRTAVLGAAAAVVLLFLGALAATLVTDAPGSGGRSTRLVATSESAAQGQARLAARPWGTAVDLELSGLPSGQHFVAWVVAEDGTREQAASWSSTADGNARLAGASSIGRGRVASLDVTTTGGTLLLSARG